MEAKVQGDFKVLDGLVTDLEGVAIELGARQAPRPATATRTGSTPGGRGG